MRAIIRSTISIDSTQIDTVLKTIQWWPTLKQDDPEVQVHSQDILAHVAAEDRTLVERTLLYTIYDEETRTWGIVNNPSEKRVTFRFKNKSSERLKLACERFVQALQRQSSASTLHLPGKGVFAFDHEIEVLEPNSDSHAFSGSILPPARFRIALAERKREAIVGAFAFILSLCLLGLTFPGVSFLFLADVERSTRAWIAGNLERFTTAALVTATLLWFEVLLHWMDLHRQTSIRWSLE